MSEREPLSLEAQWEAVMLTGLGPEARAFEALSVESVDRELREEGLDAATLERRGAALAAEEFERGAEMAAPNPDAPPRLVAFAEPAFVPPRPAPRFRFVYLAAATFAAALGVTAVVVVRNEPP